MSIVESRELKPLETFIDEEKLSIGDVVMMASLKIEEVPEGVRNSDFYDKLLPYKIAGLLQLNNKQHLKVVK